MRLIFRQRIFSWFDGYDIYDKDGNVLFTVKGQLSWGHRLHILDASGQHIGTIQEQVLTWLPKFEMYAGNTYIGCIRKELTFIHPRYVIDSLGWEVVGDFWEWDYSIVDSNGSDIAFVSKQVFRLTDTYVIDVADPGDALYALMMVLAIDAEKMLPQLNIVSLPQDSSCGIFYAGLKSGIRQAIIKECGRWNK